jgi:hypothetical protein
MKGSAVNHVTLWRDMSMNCRIDLDTSYKREHEDQVPRLSHRPQPAFAVPASITSVMLSAVTMAQPSKGKARKQDPCLISPTEPGAYLHMSSSSSCRCTMLHNISPCRQRRRRRRNKSFRPRLCANHTHSTPSAKDGDPGSGQKPPQSGPRSVHANGQT